MSLDNALLILGVIASAALRLPSLLRAAFCNSSRRAVSLITKKAEAKASAVHLVAPTGFEPATFALRGRRPKPLDDGAIKRIYQKWLGWKESNPHIRYQKPLSCH